MRHKLFAFAAVAIVSTIAAETAQAQWTQFQRNKFMAECIPACRNNPAVRNIARCEAYCECGMAEGESRFSSVEFEIMDRDASENRPNSLLEEFSKVFPICAQRVGL
jgi:hypothetical protein